MQQKITFSDACRLIADRTGISRRDVDTFLRALFGTIADSLVAGEQVRLKGIGSFKVQRMGERKSVDVNNGKVITLPAHAKLVFVPAKELAAAVNEPFAAFEAVELTDDLTDEVLEIPSDSVSPEDIESKGEMPVDTTVDSNSEGQNPDSETEFETEVIEGSGTEDMDVTIRTPEISETSEAPQAVAPLAPFVQEEAEYEDGTYIADQSEQELSGDKAETETESVAATEEREEVDETVDIIPQDAMEASEGELQQQEEEPIEVPITPEIESTVECEEDEGDSEDDEPYHHRCHHHKSSRRHGRVGFVIGFLCALLLIVIAGVLVLLLCPNTGNFIARYMQNSNTIQMMEKDSVATPVSTVDVDSVNTDSIKAEPCNPTTAEEQAIVPTAPSDAKKVYDTVSTTRYLSTIARQHYGNQHFWPYIYEENKAILGHPNRIKPGTRVVVPDLKKYNVDPKNAADIAEAKRREAEIYARYSDTPTRSHSER